MRWPDMRGGPAASPKVVGGNGDLQHAQAGSSRKPAQRATFRGTSAVVPSAVAELQVVDLAESPGARLDRVRCGALL